MKVNEDWTKASPTLISSRIKKAGMSERKCRLFCIACCNKVRKQIKHEDCLRLLELTEAWVEKPELATEVARLRRVVIRWANTIHRSARSDEDWFARFSVWCASAPKIVPPVQGFLRTKIFHPFLREIFGDLFHPVIFEPGWQSVAAVGVAQAMYDEGDFSAMPILADALEEAGCSDPQVVSHCREKGEHVRGCWVVDLVLSK
jgi:hypothetical protein